MAMPRASEISPASGLVPVPDGLAYRVASPPASAMVTPALAAELARVLEQFARDSGFGPQQPVDIYFEPGVVGHHQVGRAADIYGVGGARLDAWKKRWDDALDAANSAVDPAESAARIAQEKKINVGWRLYRAIQHYGRWSQPYGYPIQLFGPWTRSEGPWKYISDRLLYAHRDHIHVAK